MQDNTYKVYELQGGLEVEVYRGSLTDCEAYIKLHEGGYM